MAISLVAAYVFLVQGPWMLTQMQKEHQANVLAIGAAGTVAAETRAMGWFNTLFKDTGLVRASMNTTKTSRVEDAKGAEQIVAGGNQFLGWWGERVRVFWAMVYQALARVSIGLVWIPFGLVIMAPFLVDALVVRKVKSDNFGSSDPRKYEVGRRTMIAMPFLAGILLLVPFFLPPAVTMAAFITTAIALWLGVSQFEKRV